MNKKAMHAVESGNLGDFMRAHYPKEAKSKALGKKRVKGYSDKEHAYKAALKGKY